MRSSPDTKWGEMETVTAEWPVPFCSHPLYILFIQLSQDTFIISAVSDPALGAGNTDSART